MINEEWRPINGFDYYEVSNYGKVRSIDHTVFAGNRVRFVKGRERILNKNRSGYLKVHLTNGTLNYSVSKTVHRLVADANRQNKDFSYIGISACCNGRINTYRGYNWRFSNGTQF